MSGGDDPLVNVEDALNRGNRFRRADVSAIAAECRRYRIIHDEDLTFTDLEMKLRDGSLDIRAVLGDEGSNPLLRLFGAFMWSILLGDDEPEMPPNYRSCEFELSPAGSTDRIRMVAEVLAPSGKSSHQIRRELEAEIEILRAAGGGGSNPQGETA